MGNNSKNPSDEKLTFDLAVGKTAEITSSKIPTTPNPIEFATPRNKLMQEADLAIRADLTEFPKALAAYNALAHDPEALANWDMANYITVRKLGYNDHGRVHALMTGAASLAIVDLLVDHATKNEDIKWDTIESGAGDLDDVHVVVILGTMLHDIGNLVSRTNHEASSVTLAIPILERILSPIYPDSEQRTKLRNLILHSINCHDLNPAPLTMEAGVTAVADGTDITKGRGRKAYALGSVDIHSISALAVEQVTISRGQGKPVEISVMMNNSAGIFQVEETLAPKVSRTPLAQYVNVVAITDPKQTTDQRIVQSVRLENGQFIDLTRKPHD